jgi:3,4-dihydroxy 2-butanone 4-phosphate synthase/GTP cyclohydrolase II
LVLAADAATSERVNFVMRQACGLVCVAVTPERAARLGLHPMVRYPTPNTLTHPTQDDGPAFTVSVDARRTKTGISASERALTMRLLADSRATVGDFQAPGHVFPLVARGGGVLERRGHTEAGVDLARIAHLAEPAVVLCELLGEDGEPLRGKDVLTFTKRFGIVRVSVSDIVTYRRSS